MAEGGVPAQQRQIMIEQYKDKASELVAWLKGVTNRIMQKEFPADLRDMKEELTEIGRIGTDDIPKWNERKKEILKMYEDFQNDGAMTVLIDESLGPSSIEELYVKFDSVIKDREAMLSVGIARLEGLQGLFERIQKEAHNLEGKLDVLEGYLGGEGGQLNSAKSTEGNQRSVLDRELKDIDDHVTDLIKDVQVLSEGGYSHAHQVLNRVLGLMRRAGNMRTALDISATQKPPPGPSANKVVWTAQYQQSSHGAQMVETTNALQHVKFCFEWINKKHALLEAAEYGNSIDSVKQALDLHQKEHERIISFSNDVDKCMTYRENLKLVEQEPYEQWFSHVQIMYPILCKTSYQRQEYLVSLQEFLQEANNELIWMCDKEQFVCEYSRRLDELSLPDEQIYKTLMQEITSREARIQSVQNKGYTMINEKHPASETVEGSLSLTKSKWQWLKQLLNCLDKHMHDVHAYHQFFCEVQSCEQWINQQTKSVNNCIKLESKALEKLEQMKTDCENLQNALVAYEEKVAFLAKISHDIIPLKQRNQQVTFPVKVYSHFFYKHPNMSPQQHEECSLMDTSQKIQWVVQNSRGEQVTLPSICVIIPPPNYEAEAFVHRLKYCLEQLKTLVKTCDRKLIENMVVLIKTSDLGNSLGPTRCKVLLRALNDGAAKILAEVGDADQKHKQLQLKKDLDECNRKVQEFSKKLCEEAFPCQWEKFEVRFQIDNAKDNFSGTDYNIKEVSPVQMQYINADGGERESLLEKFRNNNLRALLEPGLLRVWRQEEDHIRKMTQNPNYISELKKKVIGILRHHIETHPAIEENQLSQVVFEDVQQAHELGHLECLRSNRVQIYICKSGKGVSIVGREVGKYTESICRALEERSKNNAVYSISESVGFERENEVTTGESLKYFEKTAEQASVEGSESEKHVTLGRYTIQLLTDSDFGGELCKKIPEVAVDLLSGELFFKGPPVALINAECYLEQHLKSKGYWHEVEQSASHIEASKRLNFEAYLKGKFPDVDIIFSDKKVIFIGKENMIKTSKDELANFLRAINRHCIECKSFIVNYLKFQDVQNYIWEKFESRHIECYWQVIESGIAFYYRNDEQCSSAKSVLEECIAAQNLSFISASDLQEFEDSPDVKNLIHQSKWRLHKEELQADSVIYVGMPEIIAQINELYARHMAEWRNQPQVHSSEVLLSHSLLAYVRKYQMENIKKTFNVSLLELDDLSGIKISGTEDNVKNAVSEVHNFLCQTQVSIDSLEIPKVNNTLVKQAKEIVVTVEEENKTCVEIISIPIKGKDTLRVPWREVLDICLVYGSTPKREVEMQLIPVNDSLFPVCLAATDIMKKAGVDLQKQTAGALQKYIKLTGKKPEAFKLFFDDDGGNNQRIVYFVMPEFPSMVDFQKQFQDGLFAVFDHASKASVTSLSLPVEMHEALSTRQMSTVILETLNMYMDEVEQEVSMKEIFLCSVEKGNQSVLQQVLESKIPCASSDVFIVEDYFGYNEQEDSRVNIAIVTGSLLDQKVDIIVNSTTVKLALETGSLSKAILDVAGSSILDECRYKYPNGIKFGEVAVTSAGKLKLKKIFHGALRRVDKTNLHLQSLRRLMKNCFQKVKEEKCQSIAFPALGIGQLHYPVEDVAKEMFRSVINHANKYDVKHVKFVLSEGEANVYNAFKEMENTRNSLLQSSTDCKPEYEVSLEGSGLKIAIVAAKKCTKNCDVDVVLGSPTEDTPTNQYTLKCYGSKEKTITVNRDARNWSEKLYLCLKNLTALKEELLHAVQYVKLMTFTSLSVHISPVTVDMARPAIEDVIVAFDTCKSDVGDLESVMIVINDDVLQSLTPWFEENVKASQGSKTIRNKISTYFGFKVSMSWKKFIVPCTETARTYIRIIGANYATVKASFDTIHNRLKQLRTTEGKEAKTRGSDSQSSNTNGESFDMIDMSSEGTESSVSQEVRNREVEDTSVMTPEKTSAPGAQQSQMNSEDQEYPPVYLHFRAEVPKALLKIIQENQGVEGVKALISNLEQIAQVETSSGNILVSCDFQKAKKVQECIFSHYKMEKKKLNVQDIEVKHIIEGGNSDMKDLLHFAYGSKAWNSKLEYVGGKLYVQGTQSLKEEIEAAVKTLNQWCQEEFFLSSDELQKSEDATSAVKDEYEAVFIKQTHDKIIMKGNNADSFEKAKHKMKVLLGRVKVTAKGRRGRNLQTDEPFSSLPQDNKMETSLRSVPSTSQISQNRAVTTTKTYYTQEGIMVKVYLGDIVRLPVDCIVNAANKSLSHGGGVALAIAKAAGSEFDQESEEYVRKHGTIAVTKCCVTSPGRLPFYKVIHVVGPQWQDYQHDQKDRCGDDLKKTIVNCLIKADSLNMKSLAIPSISSGIFGVPKPLCAQMYAQGVVEFSKTYGLQSLKEIHFVDTISEMCQLTQQAFDKELNNPCSNSSKSSGDTNQSHIINYSSKPRHPQASEDSANKNGASNIQRTYADVVAPTDLKQLKGNKRNPYVFKVLGQKSILIYNHDITDASVDAIVCPVCPSVEGSLAKSVKKACGPFYADNTYKKVMSYIKTEGDVIVRKPDYKENLPFKYILHVYSPRWIRSEEKEYDEWFEKLLRKSIENIFKETTRYTFNSVAIPILGIGDRTAPYNTICEYIMDGIVDFCADSYSLKAVHVVTKDPALTLQLKEIASQKLGLGGQGSLTCSEHDKESLRVTANNNSSGEPLNPSHHHTIRGHEGQKETCPICMDTPVDPVAFNICGHVLCRECMNLAMKNKPVCPVCGRAYGIIKGNQPPGTMEVKSTNTSLPGFKHCGTIEILYSFADGMQREGHPNPGKPFKGTRRRAYLPDNAEGHRVLGLLRKAFDRRLVFTIGRSVTTGAENTVTWNDIHHKTNRDGGPQNYGYPDANYLHRVQEELAAKGVTESTEC